MQTFAEKLTQVALHFNDGDFSIGYRKLIDCVLDTTNLDLYRKTIALTAWKESNPSENSALKARVLDLLDELKTIEISIPTSEKPVLVATHVCKQYGRGKFTLDAISMSIMPGDIWGLVGENGNGKTTLLRILAHDLSYDSGSVSYHLGKETRDAYALRTNLIYLPQRTPKWYGSLKSNLKFAAAHYGYHGEENELIVMMYIIRFGLWQYRNHQWNELSSGYKMRFELARTFLRKPAILLLDEPLANLDVLAQQLILEDLKNMSQSLSHPIGIVLSSQQLFEVEKVSDKILFLKQGKPTHLSEANASQNSQTTLIEADVKATRDELINALSNLSVNDIQFNGGIFLIELNEIEGMKKVLFALSQTDIKVTYLRDISQSTRRLFV